LDCFGSLNLKLYLRLKIYQKHSNLPNVNSTLELFKIVYWNKLEERLVAGYNNGCRKDKIYLWSSGICKRNAKWQYLSWLRASAFCSLKEIINVNETRQPVSGKGSIIF